VKVNPNLTVPDHPEIFVVGDLATYPHQTGVPLPGTSPVAMSQGRYVAEVITRRLQGKPPRKYHYLNKGELAVIGRAAAVADFGWVRFSGFPAWLLWLFVHLMYLVEFENRLLVFIQWGWSYFTFNRGARLITFERGQPPSQRST
jgi:NADH dehydrogenase